jgi:hypothetical protein
LRHFVALYNAVEAKDAENTGSVKLVQQFLVCAEARYVMYLDLLEQFFSKPGHRSEKQAMSEVMPLPPWYFYYVKVILMLGMLQLSSMFTVFHHSDFIPICSAVREVQSSGTEDYHSPSHAFTN